MTNGDRIRQMSDEVLSDFFGRAWNLVQMTCMRCGKNKADYFVVRSGEGVPKLPLTICVKCAKKEGLKRGDEVSGTDADKSERSSGA